LLLVQPVAACVEPSPVSQTRHLEATRRELSIEADIFRANDQGRALLRQAAQCRRRRISQSTAKSWLAALSLN